MNELLAATVKELANAGWHLFQAVNTRLPESPSRDPEWAPGPLLKSRERTKPPLGWPRETDSLCPRCVIETRDAVIRGERDLAELVNGHVGEIRAKILEENGRLVIRKTCPEHGPVEDLLSIDPEFSRIIESRYPGRDFRTFGDELIHRHGTSSIRYGRGAVLTIDLTNRCNMMCNPCFMDANQVGYVHELTLDEVKQILDDSISFKPRRQMSVQFSGGEPTVSPHFLEACHYAKEVGYYSVQAATNGLRFALEPEFAYQAKEAGLNSAYFQFDGVTNEANRHRHISNLFDAKLMAIENLHAAGIDITPVTTVVNTINDTQVGPILDFVIQNNDKMGGVSFQPVSFTGRDEEITDEDRHRQRYTISHLAHEFARFYDGKIDPYRDWYPLGAMGAFTALADHLRSLKGPEGPAFGGLCCSCHPNCGSSVLLAANKRTKAWAPLTKFFDTEAFMKDIALMIDSARGKTLTLTQIGLSFLRHFDERKAPPGLTLVEMLRVFNRKMGGSLTSGKKPPENDWKLMWVGGMWFQDLWTYDFRRTEMCVIPYATQEGEVSFCAYNTGVGWRQVVENMHTVATTRDWFKTRGRHKVYAGDRPMDLANGRRTLPVLNGNGERDLVGAGAGGCGSSCGGH
ncbi:MAG: radical SAM protein [Gemmatimonadetes bacterium]|nr:radical SAM protein [Gemmatimonadota bacterium]